MVSRAIYTDCRRDTFQNQRDFFFGDLRPILLRRQMRARKNSWRHSSERRYVRNSRHNNPRSPAQFCIRRLSIWEVQFWKIGRNPPFTREASCVVIRDALQRSCLGFPLGLSHLNHGIWGYLVAARWSLFILSLLSRVLLSLKARPSISPKINSDHRLDEGNQHAAPGVSH